MFSTATSVSDDEVERAEAYRRGYERVCRHPREVGRLGADDVLVIDFNAVSFEILKRPSSSSGSLSTMGSL